MAVITDRQEGMFPLPVEIKMSCSCPDSAGLCKHLAAVLYGVGARLDNEPELLFKLRQADQSELISHAVSSSAMPSPGAAEIDAASLSEVFGIDISTTDAQSPPEPKPKARPQKAKAKETKPITKKKPRKVVAKAKQPVAKGKSENAKAKRKKTAAKAAIKRPGTKPATQARTR